MKKIKKFFGFGKKPKPSMIEMTLFKEIIEMPRKKKAVSVFFAKYKWEKEGASIINSNTTIYSESEKKILSALFLQKMPSELRKTYWMNASGAKREMENNKDYYFNLLNNYPDYIPSGYENQIIPDLKRTFPGEDYFKDENNLQKLYRVLLAYSRRNSTIGYCQGFNFIVGRLLQILNNEEEAFWLFTMLIETILPVEHYCELSGVMCDCTILLPFIKTMVPEVVNHLSSLGFELTLNNLLYKWFVSVFMQGMNEDIWLPIWDLLFIEGYIIVFKAAIGILFLAKDEILARDNMLDINNYFEEEIVNFKSDKFTEFIINKKFSFTLDYILKKRENTLPKIIENIKQTSDYKLRQYEKKEKVECNLDWPVCLDSLRRFNIIHSMVFKVITPPKIQNDFYDLKGNTFLKVNDYRLTDSKKKKEIDSLVDEKKKKTIIFGEMVIERQNHQCGTKISTRDEILGESPGISTSPVMFDERSPSLRVISSIIEDKRGFNCSKIIESVDKSNVKLNEDDLIIRNSVIVFEEDQKEQKNNIQLDKKKKEDN